MKATKKVRRMLDERGVEWDDNSDESMLHTTWNNLSCWFNEFPDGWTSWGMSKRGTPEQAIDATLGPGTCHADETATIEGTLENGGRVIVHVMECSECGHTYEHVNGDYEHCPHCRRKVVSE